MKVGEAQYTSSRRARTNYWTHEENKILVVKIMPPLGSMADLHRWWTRACIHFSPKDTNGRVHPYYCVEEGTKKTGITTYCPACVRQAAAAGEYKAKKEAGVDKQHLGGLLGIMSTFRVDRLFYLNVMDRSGKTALLKLKPAAKDNLDTEIERLMKDGIDPIKQGVFFEFTRIGMDKDSKYPVRVCMENVQYEGRTFLDIKREPLSEAQLAHIQSNEFSGKDLGEIATRLTVEQVNLLVTGDATTVDRIFSISTKTAPATQMPAPAAAPTNQPAASSVAPSTSQPQSSLTPFAGQPPAASVGAAAVSRPPLAPPVSVTVPASVPPAAVSVTPVYPTAPLGTVAPKQPVAQMPTAEVEKLSEAELVDLFKAGGLGD